MKKLVLLAALTAAATLGLESSAFAHGGQYRGPGDTVPPGGGGAGGGAPGSPGPSGPSSPGSSGPSTPGAGPGGPGNAGGPASPVTGQGGGGEDLTQWSFWWEFNKEPYLNLKASVHGGVVVTGSEDFFLGHGAADQSKNSFKPSEAQIRQTIVPALLEALANESNNDIVTGAMIALAKIGDKQGEDGDSAFEKVIAGRLSDSVQEISETAAVSLGILANDKSVDTLKSLLDNSSDGQRLVGKSEVHYRTRSFAAYGLALIGARTGSEEIRQDIVRILMDAVDQDQTRTRDLRVACLVALGLVSLETTLPSIPEGAEMADLATGSVGQLEYLMSYLLDETNNYLVRAHAPTALVRLITSERFPADLANEWKTKLTEDFTGRLVKRSKDKNEIRQSCVLALGLLGDHDNDAEDKLIRDTLIAVPKNISDIQTRNFSLIALAQVGGRPGSGETDGVEQITKALTQQITKGASTIKPWAGLAIGVMARELGKAKIATVYRDSLAKALLATFEGSKSADKVGAYAIALGILGMPDATRPMLEKLDRVSEDVAQGYICVGLGLMDAREAIQPISDLVKDSKYKPELLKQAAIALGLLGDKELVTTLITMLEDAKALTTQAALSSALGFIGDTRSVDPLVAMLKNEDLTGSARGFAAVALGIVADKETFPWNTKIAVDLNYRASTETLNDQAGTGILNIL